YQAEDGIRDDLVTGVQTCALPISLEAGAPPWTEAQPLAPRNPYAATKAAGDLLALSHHRSFRRDVVVTRCGNTYGPRQHPEKLRSEERRVGEEGRAEWGAGTDYAE